MLNQVVLVGRLVNTPEVVEQDDGKKRANMTLAVPRPYKNSEGVYETDFIDCNLWGGVAQNTAEYCKKGDLIGIRGRIETSISNKDDKTKKYTNVMAEKVTFLSSKKPQEKDNESR